MLDGVTIAFLGGGNMAEAMVGGLLGAGVPASALRVAEPNPQRRQELAQRHGLNPLEQNGEACRGADLVVVAVKPPVVTAALRESLPGIAPTATILSIAAGIPLAALAGALPPGQPLVRAMPNTPALVGAGITALCPAPGTGGAQLELAEAVMGAVGEVLVVADEGLLDAVTALSGSGPAYVFLMAEALSDGGVACGLPRPLADRLAIHTLLGSARLLEQSGQHPGVLKNQVTSPGGTTIAGVRALEQAGVRAGLMAAVEAAWRRSRELSGRQP